MATRLFIAWIVSMLPSIAVAAEGAFFMGLGFLHENPEGSTASAVSGDGTVVVGVSLFDIPAPGSEAFRWTAPEGMVGLADLPGGEFRSTARDVSSDGSVIVGHSFSESYETEAFRWTAATGMVGLGVLPGGDQDGNPESLALAVSADGAVVVGQSDGELAIEPGRVWTLAFRWTASTGMVALGLLPGLPPTAGKTSRANDVSGDGSVIVGSAAGGRAFRWTAEEGMVDLGSVPNCAIPNQSPPQHDAFAISSDGKVIAGRVQNCSFGNTRSWSWTALGGFVLLPGLHGPSAISSDGSVIAGRDRDGAAAVWNARSGTRPFQDVLTREFGLDLSGWELTNINGVSDDGTVYVGSGKNPGGLGEAWIVSLPFGCRDAEDNDGDGLIDLNDPGCSDSDDLSERDEELACDDGLDNDNDGFTDFLADLDQDGISDPPGDPGCMGPEALREDPQCQDGVNNDLEPGIDFDGGESVWGAMIDDADPECLDMPWGDLEAVPEPSSHMLAAVALALTAGIAGRMRSES
jgi:probable HAF family extracellular repeat protein